MGKKKLEKTLMAISCPNLNTMTQILITTRHVCHYYATFILSASFKDAKTQRFFFFFVFCCFWFFIFYFFFFWFGGGIPMMTFKIQGYLLLIVKKIPENFP